LPFFPGVVESWSAEGRATLVPRDFLGLERLRADDPPKIWVDAVGGLLDRLIRFTCRRRQPKVEKDPADGLEVIDGAAPTY
jgi:hypothetical protein